MTWRQAVLTALERYCARHDSQDILRQRFIIEEMDHILRDVGSGGRTPEQTLSVTLQGLRAAGAVEFVDRGRYRLTTSGKRRSRAL